MAVAFDSHFEKGQGSGASPFSFVSNAGTVTGTVGGLNRVLIGVAGFSDTAANLGTVTMTWAGVSMTPIVSVAAPAGGFTVYQFGLIAPATGNQTLSVAWTGASSPAVALGAVNSTGADQSVGWANGSSDTGTGLSASSAVTTTSGDMAIVGHTNNNATSTVIATGTSDWIETAFTGNYAMARNPAVGPSTTVAWTLGSSVAWANVKVDVLQLSAGAMPGLKHRPFPFKPSGTPNPIGRW